MSVSSEAMDERSDSSACNLKYYVPKIDNDSTGQTVESNARKNEKMCNVKDSFPQIEIPKNCIHIIKNIRDWEAIAENFLQTVHRTKVST